jgi:general secretion pathway protein D
VVLLNNQTLVLAGLIQDRRGASDRGIPVLNKIPFIGYLFGFKERTVEKRELILLITPRVVGTPLDAQRITDQMRRATPQLDEAVRNAPRAPATTPPPTTTPGAPSGLQMPSAPSAPGAGVVAPGTPPAATPPTGVPPAPAAPPPR